MIEPSEIARWERNLRTMLRKAADEDPEGFAVVDQLLRKAVAALPYAAELTRRQHGYSWADMAHGLGASRSSTHLRLALPRDEAQADGLALLSRIAELVTYDDQQA